VRLRALHRDDRRFLVAHCPSRQLVPLPLGRRVDHKRAVPSVVPDALAAAPAKATNHRAMDDIKESVAELAYYRRAIFRAGEPASALTNRQGDDQG